MLKIDENTIYDPATGISYTLGESWDYAQSYDEAKASGETWARVSVGSVHSSGETYGLVFEKEAAVHFWELLNQKVGVTAF